MPRGYRCIVLAAFGWLILAAVNPPPQKAKNAGGDNGATKAPSPSPSPSYAPYSNLNSNACYQAKDHDTADLCAQWRAAIAAEKAAKAAEESIKWSIAATILSALGLIALAVTLIQSGIALRRGRDANLLLMKENARTTRRSLASGKDTAAALKVARQNANAAAKLVKVSQENSEKQLRAYLDFDGVCFMRDTDRDTDDAISTGISIKVRNYGHTPANDVRIEYYFQMGPNRATVHDDQKAKIFGAIAPQDHSTARTIFPISRDMWAYVTGAHQRFFVVVKVAYSDEFGTPHTLESEFENNPNWQEEFGTVLGTRRST